MYSLYYLVQNYSSDFCAAIVQLYCTHYLYYLVLHFSLDLCAAYLDYFAALTQKLCAHAAPTESVAATASGAARCFQYSAATHQTMVALPWRLLSSVPPSHLHPHPNLILSGPSVPYIH